MSLVSALSDLLELPVQVDGHELEPLAAALSPDFTRRTTVVHLHGGGEEGVGEDVTWEADEQEAFQAAGAGLEPAADHTLDSFCRALSDDLSDLRRWGLESAALDLALRQAGRSLADVLGRRPRPLTFVVSDPDLRGWRRHYRDLRFKLDARPDWTAEEIGRLAATGCVTTVDLKGHYRGPDFSGPPPDVGFYRRVCQGFADAWIEDAWVDEETRPVLEPHAARLTFDAPLHSVADAEALPFEPRCLNVKPSRFGSLRRLFEFYEWCRTRRVAMYAGGQLELGPGRGQAQLLAALFHPDGPNDIAPGEFNVGEPRPGLPVGPLTLRPRETGFSLEGGHSVPS